MKHTIRTCAVSMGLMLVSLLFAAQAFAHCQIPCGIYDDEARTNMIAEHITTVEKSMNQILELQKQTPVNYNQLVRWVNNKEEHAQEIQEIVYEYFLAQRIKPSQKKYTEKLVTLHAIIVQAMKAKQTVDLKYVKELRESLATFTDLYFAKE